MKVPGKLKASPVQQPAMPELATGKGTYQFILHTA